MITTCNSEIFRRPGWDGRKTGRLKHFDDGDLNALGCRFSLRDKGKAVCGKGGCQWEGEEKTGLECCVWLVYKEVYEDFSRSA